MSSGWLNAVGDALDMRERPLALFLRDDDAGWADERLAQLLNTCASHHLPIDLAVIPSELTDERADWLLNRRRTYSARLGLHQHGWAHANHEVAGRKCEFGGARALNELRADVARGQARMVEAFGPAADPIFTPPWNRCVAAIGPLLVELGVGVLSRDITADPLGVAGLRECPVHVDWSAMRSGVRLTTSDLAASCAHAFGRRSVAGLLLHHAVMTADDFANVSDLLALLSNHPMVHAVSLLDAATLASSSAQLDATPGRQVAV